LHICKKNISSKLDFDCCCFVEGDDDADDDDDYDEDSEKRDLKPFHIKVQHPSPHLVFRCRASSKAVV